MRCIDQITTATDLCNHTHKVYFIDVCAAWRMFRMTGSSRYLPESASKLFFGCVQLLDILYVSHSWLFIKNL